MVVRKLLIVFVVVLEMFGFVLGVGFLFWLLDFLLDRLFVLIGVIGSMEFLSVMFWMFWRFVMRFCLLVILF